LVALLRFHVINILINSLGDGILVQPSGITDEKWYEGVVHEVRSEAVLLRFHSSFPGWTPTRPYCVRFGYNRIPMRRMHQAINQPFNDNRIFFPLQEHVKATPSSSGLLTPYNSLIQVNRAQWLAVKSIIQLQDGAHPFIVFGP
jgi:helicase MOV-10